MEGVAGGVGGVFDGEGEGVGATGGGLGGDGCYGMCFLLSWVYEEAFMSTAFWMVHECGGLCGFDIAFFRQDYRIPWTNWVFGADIFFHNFLPVA